MSETGSKHIHESLIFCGVLIVCLASFVTGINWGLPSRRADAFLFGERIPWTGAQILALTGDRPGQSALGADVDRNPITRGAVPIVLNATDQQRAEIVRRFRLYTCQPDEMITMMALASMKPARRDFDPRLYQYGGMWIYPVGALIRTFGNPKSDQAYYLDHPEEFARFYLIARLYCVAWAMVGAVAVYWISRRLSSSVLVAASATLCYAFMPVVVNMAHEAKPHLPGAVLILLACMAATKFVETGLKRWWVLAGVACGAAAGMVLSAVPVIAVLPIMLWIRKCLPSQRVLVLVTSLIIAVDVYFLSNPYVLIHLLGDRTILLSNLRNSQAMYQAPPSTPGVWNAIKLLAAGATPLLLVIGLAATAALALPSSRKRMISCNPAIVWLLGSVSVLLLVQFGYLAGGKPAEHARFALLPDVALMLIAVLGVGSLFPNHWARSMAMTALVAVTGMYGFSYNWHFARDSVERSTKIIAAERLSELNRAGDNTLALAAEPAPYSLPPVDLFTWRLLLLAPGDARSTVADVSIRTVDQVPADYPSGFDFWIRPRLLPTPISWASKPFEVLVRHKPSPQVILGDIMQGVTTALVAFIFFCVIFPERVKNRPQFYAGFGLVCLILLLDALNNALGASAFRVFTYFATAILQIGAILILFMAAGGLSWQDLKGEMGNAYEVIRRGGEEKEVIIPLTGQMPKRKTEEDESPPERIPLDTPESPKNPRSE